MSVMKNKPIISQEVISDFKEAGFPVELMFDWENRLAKFLDLQSRHLLETEPSAYLGSGGTIYPSKESVEMYSYTGETIQPLYTNPF
jgi:hypothetical protein